MRDEATIEYFRTVSSYNQQNKDIDSDTRQAIVDDVIKKVRTRASNNAFAQMFTTYDLDKGGRISPDIKVGTVIIQGGKRYTFIGGDYKNPSNYKEVK